MTFAIGLLVSVLVFLVGASFASLFYLVGERLSHFLYEKGEQQKISSKKWVKFSKGIIVGRSECNKCKRVLGFWELFPVLNRLFLKGKCKECGYTVPTKYLFAELALGFVFVYVFISLFSFSFGVSGFLRLVIAYLVVLVLYLFSVIDFEVRKVPNLLIYPVLIIGLLVVVLLGGYVAGYTFIFERLVAALGGFFFIYFVNLLKGGRAFGWGDAKFLLFLGLVLGKYLLLAFLIAVFTGAAVGGVAYLVQQKKQDFSKFSIPFVPFLSFGALLMYISGDNIWDFFINLIFYGF